MKPNFLKIGFQLPRIIGPTLLAAVWAVCPQFAVAQQPAGDLPAPVATASPKNGALAVTTSSSDDQYRIGPGDVLSIQVFNRTQLSREESVDTRGMISMPLLEGEIQASCLTEKELGEEIARRYREGQLLKNPSVYVSVKDYQSQPVAVLGAVNSPGRFQLRRRVRLLELLVFHAGGPAAKAGRKIQILSTVGANQCGGPVDTVAAEKATTKSADDGVVTYDLNDLLRGNEEINVYVRQGDIVNIPTAEEVIVVGNVVRPTTVPIVEPITLGRAIAMAGGTLPNTKKDKIRITRPSPGSTATTEFLVDMKATDKTKGEGFLLQGGDIVEVSTNSGLRTILRNLATSMVPMVSNMPVRIIP
ncbi:MAG: polysaccharide biosynthesis/export family protein [Pyrinomonadaceae bacterium]